jgi:serine phosphatase RsbU (regulator of sigma subunit)
MTRKTSSDVLGGLLRRAHLIAPGELAPVVAEHAGDLGASDAAIYLADYEQRLLVPVPNRRSVPRDELVIDATVGGRSFRALEVHQSTGPDGGTRVWVPLVDGAERLGVLELTFDAGQSEPSAEEVRAFASLVAQLVMSKSAYGDALETVRRRQSMSLAAELAWQLVPPLTFATDRVVISAALVPPYDLGGDTFDYGVDFETARIAVFDAMGHGLEAGLLATVTVAAYRSSRRRRQSLEETVEAIDLAITTQFGVEHFVTGVLAELDIASGRLRWCVAGHPRPLLLRGGKIVKTLEGNVGLPLGLNGPAPAAEEALEPGDQILLFTDGVVEARSVEGEFFGLARLEDLTRRASASENAPPEMMRQLVHAILSHQAGDLQDDATIVLVEWRGPGSEQLTF